MTLFFHPTRLCLATATAVLALEAASAWTVGPPIVLDVPKALPGVMVETSSSSSSSRVTTTSVSNLPAQRDLLERVGSFSVASAAPPKAIASTKPASAKTTAAKPASAIVIAEINFDGKVPKTESDEYVVIQNSSKEAIDVSGYSLYPATTGKQGSTFSFPEGSTLAPKSSVRIYTNEVHKETGGYSWGSKKALWNNGGGLAVLLDGRGNTIGEYKYAPPGASSPSTKRS